MRRFGTGLFNAFVDLYKARAAFGRLPPPSLRRGEKRLTRQCLWHDGIERNIGMEVALSVVVPVKDEAENMAPLAREIAAALAGEQAELIFIDDGSADATVAELTTLKEPMPSLRVIQHGRNIGQSVAIRTGVRASRGDIVVTLDGDGQNGPRDIPRLVAMLRAPNAKNFGMVSGVRQHKQEAVNKKWASGLRQFVPPIHAERRRFGCRLRVEGVPARPVPRPTLFRSHAPIPDRAGAARGLRRAPCRG